MLLCGRQGWRDVGGLSEVKAALKESLVLPVKYGAWLAAAPLRMRTGMLLYGPPGCGKTHLVNATVAATKVRPHLATRCTQSTHAECVRFSSLCDQLIF